MKALIYVTLKNGAELKVYGDSHEALDRFEQILKLAGFKFNEKVETWDEGFYHD